MACPNITKELKCKFPPCPCKKCVALRTERIEGGFCGLLPDTPPERPTSECCDHHDKTKCACKLKEIGPPYQRKYTPDRQKHNKPFDNDESDLDEGACNTNYNLSTFMINIISFIALVVIAAIVFWLKMCYWTFMLGLHIYHSNRTTQMTVLGLFGLLILCMCCTYAMGSSSKSGSKVISAAPKCKGPKCDDGGKVKENTVFASKDDEGREVFKQSKLYAIPMDMKQPPALIVYLQGLFFGDE